MKTATLPVLSVLCGLLALVFGYLTVANWPSPLAVICGLVAVFMAFGAVWMGRKKE